MATPERIERRSDRLGLSTTERILRLRFLDLAQQDEETLKRLRAPMTDCRTR